MSGTVIDGNIRDALLILIVNAFNAYLLLFCVTPLFWPNIPYPLRLRL